MSSPIRLHSPKVAEMLERLEQEEPVFKLGSWAESSSDEEEELPEPYDVVRDGESKTVPCTNAKIFELLGIPKTHENMIKIRCTYGDLVLLHYSDETSDNDPVEVRAVRGTVVDTKRNQVICKSLPYTIEIPIGPEKPDKRDRRLERFVPSDLSDVKVYEATEGTIIRCFYHVPLGHDKGSWFWSTHHKLSAHNSMWGEVTFGTMFEECLDHLRKYKGLDVTNFDKKYCYVFMMMHPENVLVCHNNITKALKLLHVYEADDKIMKELPIEPVLVSLKGIEGPDVIKFKRREKLVKATVEIDPTRISGFMINYVNKNTGALEPIKLTNKKYLAHRVVRGNEPNLNVRYLSIRNVDKNLVLLQSLTDLHPHKADRFHLIEDELRYLYKMTYKLYMETRGSPENCELDKPEVELAKSLGRWHGKNPMKNLVTRKSTADYINSIKPTKLWKILREVSLNL